MPHHIYTGKGNWISKFLFKQRVLFGKQINFITSVSLQGNSIYQSLLSLSDAMLSLIMFPKGMAMAEKPLPLPSQTLLFHLFKPFPSIGDPLLMNIHITDFQRFEQACL